MAACADRYRTPGDAERFFQLRALVQQQARQGLADVSESHEEEFVFLVHVVHLIYLHVRLVCLPPSNVPAFPASVCGDYPFPGLNLTIVASFGLDLGPSFPVVHGIGRGCPTRPGC